MPAPATGRASVPLIVVRAGILGAVVVLLGSVSHVSADGLLPHPVLVGVLLVLFGALGSRFLLKASAVSGARLVTLVVVGQALAHIALSLTAGHRVPAGTPGADALNPDEGSPVGVAVSHFISHLFDVQPEMVFTHLLAAAAAGAWLAVGESALWSLIALASANLDRLVLAVPRALGWCSAVRAKLALALVGQRHSGERCFAPRPQVWLRADSPRGPPALLAV